MPFTVPKLSNSNPVLKCLVPMTGIGVFGLLDSTITVEHRF